MSDVGSGNRTPPSKSAREIEELRAKLESLKQRSSSLLEEREPERSNRPTGVEWQPQISLFDLGHFSHSSSLSADVKDSRQLESPSSASSSSSLPSNVFKTSHNARPVTQVKSSSSGRQSNAGKEQEDTAHPPLAPSSRGVRAPYRQMSSASDTARKLTSTHSHSAETRSRTHDIVLEPKNTTSKEREESHGEKQQLHPTGPAWEVDLQGLRVPRPAVAKDKEKGGASIQKQQKTPHMKRTKTQSKASSVASSVAPRRSNADRPIAREHPNQPHEDSRASQQSLTPPPGPTTQPQVMNPHPIPPQVTPPQAPAPIAMQKPSGVPTDVAQGYLAAPIPPYSTLFEAQMAAMQQALLTLGPSVLEAWIARGLGGVPPPNLPPPATAAVPRKAPSQRNSSQSTIGGAALARSPGPASAPSPGPARTRQSEKRSLKPTSEKQQSGTTFALLCSQHSCTSTLQSGSPSRQSKQVKKGASGGCCAPIRPHTEPAPLLREQRRQQRQQEEAQQLRETKKDDLQQQRQQRSPHRPSPVFGKPLPAATTSNSNQKNRANPTRQTLPAGSSPYRCRSSAHESSSSNKNTASQADKRRRQIGSAPALVRPPMPNQSVCPMGMSADTSEKDFPEPPHEDPPSPSPEAEDIPQEHPDATPQNPGGKIVHRITSSKDSSKRGVSRLTPPKPANSHSSDGKSCHQRRPVGANRGSVSHASSSQAAVSVSTSISASKKKGRPGAQSNCANSTTPPSQSRPFPPKSSPPQRIDPAAVWSDDDGRDQHIHAEISRMCAEQEKLMTLLRDLKQSQADILSMISKKDSNPPPAEHRLPSHRSYTPKDLHRNRTHTHTDVPYSPHTTDRKGSTGDHRSRPRTPPPRVSSLSQPKRTPTREPYVPSSLKTVAISYAQAASDLLFRSAAQKAAAEYSFLPSNRVKVPKASPRTRGLQYPHTAKGGSVKRHHKTDISGRGDDECRKGSDTARILARMLQGKGRQEELSDTERKEAGGKGRMASGSLNRKAQLETHAESIMQATQATPPAKSERPPREMTISKPVLSRSHPSKGNGRSPSSSPPAAQQQPRPEAPPSRHEPHVHDRAHNAVGTPSYSVENPLFVSTSINAEDKGIQEPKTEQRNESISEVEGERPVQRNTVGQLVTIPAKVAGAPTPPVSTSPEPRFPLFHSVSFPALFRAPVAPPIRTLSAYPSSPNARPVTPPTSTLKLDNTPWQSPSPPLHEPAASSPTRTRLPAAATSALPQSSPYSPIPFQLGGMRSAVLSSARSPPFDIHQSRVVSPLTVRVSALHSPPSLARPHTVSTPPHGLVQFVSMPSAPAPGTPPSDPSFQRPPSAPPSTAMPQPQSPHQTTRITGRANGVTVPQLAPAGSPPSSAPVPAQPAQQGVIARPLFSVSPVSTATSYISVGRPHTGHQRVHPPSWGHRPWPPPSGGPSPFVRSWTAGPFRAPTPIAPPPPVHVSALGVPVQRGTPVKGGVEVIAAAKGGEAFVAPIARAPQAAAALSRSPNAFASNAQSAQQHHGSLFGFVRRASAAPNASAAGISDAGVNGLHAQMGGEMAGAHTVSVRQGTAQTPIQPPAQLKQQRSSTSSAAVPVSFQT
uniref:Uncharacterized protein n=1 Tax=Chromera velia CCMP2878 TaxID=1169474 RepID=A0A0G4IBU8_9ALVE|eukprot:Cvel_12936.t1-p1 / transcript=Cvel_12936.t1 / gene=Cvel_12936 / organism=Chromera_velia_CCMP2878 / gene_product=Putative uncharacterized protein FLJ22184, putative / transcript_product=Putative uncharacterized protein FLJ22184, putative / location=Cvel_scaffold865:40119-45994(+) / protein_length=1594 / sequence_SO=supercontig / SO=protein_coding / is_pseudo=false